MNVDKLEFQRLSGADFERNTLWILWNARALYPHYHMKGIIRCKCCSHDDFFTDACNINFAKVKT